MKKNVKPRYHKSSAAGVFKQLRGEANALVNELAPARRRTIIFKAILFPLLYILIYTVILMAGNKPLVFYAGYFLPGILLVIIFLNIIHDAVHGTIFSSKAWNEWYVYLFDLMGANSYICRMRHVRFHHHYPNINGWDTDIEQSKLVRIFPNATLLPFHRYQHIYMPLLYPLYLFNWLLLRDFKDFFNKKKTVRKLVNILLKEYVKLFAGKIFFFLI